MTHGDFMFASAGRPPVGWDGMEADEGPLGLRVIDMESGEEIKDCVWCDAARGVARRYIQADPPLTQTFKGRYGIFLQGKEQPAV